LTKKNDYYIVVLLINNMEEKMNETIRNILERRSIRKHLQKQVDEDVLNEILNAGLYAPSAGSRQSSIIVVCQDNDINVNLGKINQIAFKGNRKEGNVSKEQPSIADDPSIANGFYDAPTVLTIFSPKNFNFPMADACVMAQNIMIAAKSLGIGSCMIGRAVETFESEYGQQLKKEWNIDENYEAMIHVILGYGVDTNNPTPKARKDGRIIRI
jgi:nitroreductase